ncbi:hypothetical protein HAX54_034244 [Datura stramonium]|uniref:Uncharacterized protein n=1 Tax=Datura stramonium TaxID=4076 RepID=A0ABS8SDY8_DATST|nr:hypothetical protein [Datura stramonium]
MKMETRTDAPPEDTGETQMPTALREIGYQRTAHQHWQNVGANTELLWNLLSISCDRSTDRGLAPANRWCHASDARQKRAKVQASSLLELNIMAWYFVRDGARRLAWHDVVVEEDAQRKCRLAERCIASPGPLNRTDLP